MLTLKDDSLLIQFPKLQSDLAECAARYVDAWRKNIAVRELVPAAEQLLATDWSWLSAKEKDDGRRIIRAITTPEQLAVHLKECVETILGEHRPEVEISFQRTLRLPDDGTTYPLPPGLGKFPLRSLMVRGEVAPADWQPREGVFMPMYQAEALWLNFETSYPVALKVGTGLVNAVTGKPWAAGLSLSPQDHLILPEQPWLDGYYAGPGMIRQFVATRLGDGYTAEEQIKGTTMGGLQFEAIPIKAGIFFDQELMDELPRTATSLVEAILRSRMETHHPARYCLNDSVGMGLAPGGRMKQHIYKDPWAEDAWELPLASRCWVHLCHAAQWLQMTGEMPPHKPISAADYAMYGLPWFDFYREDLDAIEGSPILAGLKSVFALASARNDASIPQESAVTAGPVVVLGPGGPTNVLTEWGGC